MVERRDLVSSRVLDLQPDVSHSQNSQILGNAQFLPLLAGNSRQRHAKRELAIRRPLLDGSAGSEFTDSGP